MTILFNFYNMFIKRKIDYLDLDEAEGINSGLMILLIDVILILIYKHLS